jgi:hypothetical protein
VTNPSDLQTSGGQPQDGVQRVFISYRRSDCQPQANGLYDGLRHRLPTARVFMDIDSIPPGVDFAEHIRREIEQCDVVLVLIGDNWLDSVSGPAVRRIDQPDDFVRHEIESAFEAPGIRIVPVLVEGATMPPREELPESIQRLARINAIELSDRRWTSDMERLAALLKEIAAEATERAPERRPEEAVDPGSVDQRPAPARAEEMPRRAMTPPPPGSAGGSAGGPHAYVPAPLPPRRGGSPLGWLLVAVPVLTCGLGAFAVPAWIAATGATDERSRRRMWLAAGALAVGTVLSLAAVTAAPKNAEGDSEGPLATLGVVGMLVLAVLGATLAVMHRRRAGMPGSAEELSRRRLRQQYKKLIDQDRVMAVTMRLGRPDLTRDYSDGGLLDLNALSATALVEHGRVRPDDATSIVEARSRLGSFSSVDHVLANASVSESTAALLRETAIFL